MGVSGKRPTPRRLSRPPEVERAVGSIALRDEVMPDHIRPLHVRRPRHVPLFQHLRVASVVVIVDDLVSGRGGAAGDDNVRRRHR